MEVMKFIFSRFWVWFGVLILVCGVLNGAQGIIRAFQKPQRTVKVNKFKDGTIMVEITRPDEKDIERVVADVTKEREQGVMVPYDEVNRKEDDRK